MTRQPDARAAGKAYDRAYFDHWYRAPERRAARRQASARKARLALAAAEYYLGRPLQSVLDVGCGEGAWREPLLALRPKLHYLGLDSSEYAVARYGMARNLRLARFGQLAELRFDASVDLLVCADVLHYVPDAELRRGLSGLAELCHGVCFLETYCAGDPVSGDLHGFLPRSARWYRSRFARAGLTPLGAHLYATPPVARELVALERAG